VYKLPSNSLKQIKAILVENDIDHEIEGHDWPNLFILQCTNLMEDYHEIVQQFLLQMLESFSESTFFGWSL
jgi:hypothetical protein